MPQKVCSVHQFSFLVSSDSLSPLVSKSAGFLLVGTYRHCFGSVAVWIFPTRFATQALKDRLVPLIHQSTFMLSDQKVAQSKLAFKILKMDPAIPNPRTAAINSSRGMLIAAMGATLDFAATNLVDTAPFL